MYGLLADIILVLHVGFASFVVLGLVVIWGAAFIGASWVQGRWFRGVHLVAMGVVVAESLVGVVCPLTSWESSLRSLAGQEAAYEQSFMHHWAQEFFYFDLPPWAFTCIYLAFFAAMIGTIWLVPVDWKGKKCRGKCS